MIGSDRPEMPSPGTRDREKHVRARYRKTEQERRGSGHEVAQLLSTEDDMLGFDPSTLRSRFDPR
jgi:hypothetical protein